MSFNLTNVGGPYLSLKKKESKCMVFPSSRKRGVRQFDVVVVQRRQEKRVMDVHSHRVAILTLLLFCRPCCFPYMYVWIHIATTTRNPWIWSRSDPASNNVALKSREHLTLQWRVHAIDYGAIVEALRSSLSFLTRGPRLCSFSLELP